MVIAREKLRLVGYVRVSDDEQADGYSPDTQEKRIQNYADAQDYTLVGIYKDIGVSGRYAPGHKKRAGMREAMARIACAEANALVVVKLHRLSRRVAHILALSADAQKNNWHLVSVEDQLDTSTAVGRFFLTMLGALAEMESEQLGERVAVSMRHLITQRQLTARYTPFGTRLEDGSYEARRRLDGDGKSIAQHLVPCEDEIELLKQMTAFEIEGLNHNSIATALNRKGIFSPRTGKKWRGDSVESILKTAKKYQRILEGKP